MKLTLPVLSLCLALLLGSCQKKEEQPQQAQSQAEPVAQMQPAHPAQQSMPVALAHTGEVQEVLQANAYTYLKVKENDQEFWIAVTKRESTVGETISFSQGSPMPNWESKDLQRTFEMVYLVDRVGSPQDGSSAMGPHATMGAQPTADAQAALMSHHKKTATDKLDITIEPVEGGITLADLFANRANYASKAVTVKGKVTKVNRAIMGKNWVHLQDGTSDAGVYDLTITTQDQVNEGDIAAFTGTITLNKDFGSGYSYEIIMQDAKQLKEE